jgi:hypothetical protein
MGINGVALSSYLWWLQVRFYLTECAADHVIRLGAVNKFRGLEGHRAIVNLEDPRWPSRFLQGSAHILEHPLLEDTSLAVPRSKPPKTKCQRKAGPPKALTSSCLRHQQQHFSQLTCQRLSFLD